MKPYYEHGGITIYHGDCFDVLHDLSGIGAVVTDPPYSSGGTFRGDRVRAVTSKYTRCMEYRPEFSNDHFDQRTYMLWTEAWLRLIKKSCSSGAVFLSFTDWRQLPALTDCMQFAGWSWRNLATWWKPGIRMQRGRFSSSAEYVVYASNGPITEGKSSPQNVFSCKVDGGRDHVAQKPEPVMLWVLSVCPAGAVVLDPFMGSGSTLVAGKKLGMQAIGIEIEERYCELAAHRLSQESMQFGGASCGELRK